MPPARPPSFVTINQKPAIQQGQETRQTRSGPVVLPTRDVRRKRPPVVSFLLRRATAAGDRADGRAAGRRPARRLGRPVHRDAWSSSCSSTGSPLDAAWSTTRHFLAFAYLLTVLAFARLDLYADRPRRPGFSKIATGLFQATLLGLIFSLADGEHFSSYWIFYGSFAFGLLYDGSLRETYTQLTGRLLEQVGYRRRAVLVGSGNRIGAVADALEGDARASVDIVGYLSLGMPPRSGLRPLGGLDDLDAVIAAEQVDEVIIADPDFPQGPALDLVETCHRAGDHRPRRTLDDGDPGRARGVRPRRVGAAVHAAPAGVRRRAVRGQAQLRSARRGARCWCSSPPCSRCARSRSSSPAAGRSSTARCAPGSAPGRSRA